MVGCFNTMTSVLPSLASLSLPYFIKFELYGLFSLNSRIAASCDYDGHCYLQKTAITLKNNIFQCFPCILSTFQ